jgi:hypothetical protein
MIFISCGQFSKDEKDLGNEVASLVRDLTNYEPYFAENQSTFEGLTQNIFQALDRCSGFIGIMHHRGDVSTPYGFGVRASVWIEQEIAIAAFIGQVRKRPLSVAAYIQKGIKLEGVREKLLLNPIEFESSDDVLHHLKSILPSWQLASRTENSEPELDVKINHVPKQITADTIQYQFSLTLINVGLVTITGYRVEVEFPIVFLNDHWQSEWEERERRTDTHRFFRTTHENYPKKELFEGDRYSVSQLEYFLNELNDTAEAKQELCRVVVRSGSTVLKDIKMPMAELLKGQYEDA